MDFPNLSDLKALLGYTRDWFHSGDARFHTLLYSWLKLSNISLLTKLKNLVCLSCCTVMENYYYYPANVDISPLRENYISPEFREDQVEADHPLDQFKIWFDDAVAANLKEPNAMALSTAGKDGRPYTNYGSHEFQ